jgi:hypothetical protein
LAREPSSQLVCLGLSLFFLTFYSAPFFFKKKRVEDMSSIFVESSDLWLLKKQGFNFYLFKTYFQPIFLPKTLRKHHDKPENSSKN